jgi:transposase
MIKVLAAAHFRAMELITIQNRCHRHRGFVYQHARFSPDKQSIEVSVRPRQGSAAICSRCHQPARGYDQLAERRFEFIPLWGFFVFLLYAMRRVDCRHCSAVVVEEVPWGDGKRTLTKAYMLLLARGARHVSWKETAQAFRRLRPLQCASLRGMARTAGVVPCAGQGRANIKNSAMC